MASSYCHAGGSEVKKDNILFHTEKSSISEREVQSVFLEQYDTKKGKFIKIKHFFILL